LNPGGAAKAAAVKGPALAALLFHGSPHKFDKFDMSKIGTGEGAQAYGHGLYFAEKPEVAREYAKKLSDYADPRARPLSSAPIDKDLDFLVSDYFSVYDTASNDSLRKFVKQQADKWERSGSTETPASAVLARYDELVKDGTLRFPKPNLYKVDVPDEAIGKMLDWDKPLSRQPETVRAALKDSGLLKAYKDNLSDFSSPQDTRGSIPSGARLHAFLEWKLGSSEAASAKLNELGIPGIKYKDAGSRDRRGGTSNFVLFDDQLPKIIGIE
jgi:hypothetical protein